MLVYILLATWIIVGFLGLIYVNSVGHYPTTDMYKDGIIIALCGPGAWIALFISLFIKAPNGSNL